MADATNEIIVEGTLASKTYREKTQTWTEIVNEPTISLMMYGPSTMTISGHPTRIAYHFVATGGYAAHLRSILEKGDSKCPKVYQIKFLCHPNGRPPHDKNRPSPNNGTYRNN